jgi:hypothetical protein
VARRNVDFFCAVVIVGLLDGIAGLATTEVLRFVEHLTYHCTFGTLLAGITGSSPVRRAVGPMVGGTLAAVGWWILRSSTEVPSLARTIARHDGNSPGPLWLFLVFLLTACGAYGLKVLVAGRGVTHPG